MTAATLSPVLPVEVILFYKYVNVPDVEAVSVAQEELCRSLGIAGRIRMASEGINGLLAASSSVLARYRDAMNRADSPATARG